LTNADAEEVDNSSVLAKFTVSEDAKLEYQLVEVSPEDVAISSWYRSGEDSAALHSDGSARAVVGTDLDDGVPS